MKAPRASSVALLLRCRARPHRSSRSQPPSSSPVCSTSGPTIWRPTMNSPAPKTSTMMSNTSTTCDSSFSGYPQFARTDVRKNTFSDDRQHLPEALRRLPLAPSPARTIGCIRSMRYEARRGVGRHCKRRRRRDPHGRQCEPANHVGDPASAIHFGKHRRALDRAGAGHAAELSAACGAFEHTACSNGSAASSTM